MRFHILCNHMCQPNIQSMNQQNIQSMNQQNIHYKFRRCMQSK
jgi:hypothetical protein